VAVPLLDGSSASHDPPRADARAGSGHAISLAAWSLSAELESAGAWRKRYLTHAPGFVRPPQDEVPHLLLERAGPVGVWSGPRSLVTTSGTAVRQVDKIVGGSAMTPASRAG
jgi:hypothetical protein